MALLFSIIAVVYAVTALADMDSRASRVLLVVLVFPSVLAGDVLLFRVYRQERRKSSAKAASQDGG